MRGKGTHNWGINERQVTIKLDGGVGASYLV